MRVWVKLGLLVALTWGVDAALLAPYRDAAEVRRQCARPNPGMLKMLAPATEWRAAAPQPECAWGPTAGVDLTD